jgi:hypothetical protein
MLKMIRVELACQRNIVIQIELDALKKTNNVNTTKNNSILKRGYSMNVLSSQLESNPNVNNTGYL